MKDNDVRIRVGCLDITPVCFKTSEVLTRVNETEYGTYHVYRIDSPCEYFLFRDHLQTLNFSIGLTVLVLKKQTFYTEAVYQAHPIRKKEKAAPQISNFFDEDSWLTIAIFMISDFVS